MSISCVFFLSFFLSFLFLSAFSKFFFWIMAEEIVVQISCLSEFCHSLRESSAKPKLKRTLLSILGAKGRDAFDKLIHVIFYYFPFSLFAFIHPWCCFFTVWLFLFVHGVRLVGDPFG
jgi:hypothetical protein